MRSARVLSPLSAVLVTAFAAILLAGAASAQTLRARAWIDGRSQLVLQGDTAQWNHFDWAAPGRLNCDTGTPIEPTLLGSTLWYPNWPDTQSCENRDCNCSSDVFHGLAPSLPAADFSVVLHVLQSRGATAIAEYPSASNGWRVVVEFDDSGPGGAEWYEVDVEVVPVTPPIVVSAQCDPFLAGQPPGTTTHMDVAPEQSPFLVPLVVSCGTVRVVNVSGTASYGPATPFYGPEDGPPQPSVSDLGIAGFTVPLCGLLGVFLPDTTNSGPAPAALDFTTPESRDFARLEPQLFQPFFVGDGLRADGMTPQDFVIPAGATRLYLGTCDGEGWFNNLGGFDCAVVQTPCGTPACFEWDLEQEFLLDPDHQNPNRDRCMNPGVWHFMQSDAATFPARDPAGYTLLPTHDRFMFDIEGLESWQGTEVQAPGYPLLPYVGINVTGELQSPLGIEWPPNTLCVHPAGNRHAVVGWRSPWTGTVNVTGGVQDLDPTCASSPDGVAWFIDRYDGVANTNVASGVIADGAAQDFVDGTGGANLAALSVQAGEFLFFVVSKGSDLGCDTTALRIVIHPANSGVPFCFGDGLDTTHTTPCPCANEGAPGHGCGNSVNPDGGLLVGSGDVALDDVVLTATGMPSTVACIFLQGDGLADAVLNDGVRCVGGNLIRLRVRHNVFGASTFPDAFDTWTLSSRGRVTVGSGAVRHYQVYYRNAAVSFCPAGASNLTNGWTIVW